MFQYQLDKEVFYYTYPPENVQISTMGIINVKILLKWVDIYEMNKRIRQAKKH